MRISKLILLTNTKILKEKIRGSNLKKIREKCERSLKFHAVTKIAF